MLSRKLALSGSRAFTERQRELDCEHVRLVDSSLASRTRRRKLRMPSMPTTSSKAAWTSAWVVSALSRLSSHSWNALTRRFLTLEQSPLASHSGATCLTASIGSRS